MADYSKKTRDELKELCKERGLKGYSTKKKDELIALLVGGSVPPLTPPSLTNEVITTAAPQKNALSLFSGAGGDTCGLERTGWTVTHFSEFNPTAIQTHLAAFPSSTLLSAPDGTNDVKKVADATFVSLRGKADLIFAGFPCFVAGTQVLTNSGYKAIESVTLDDTLLTHTGAFQKIVNLQRKTIPAGTPLCRMKLPTSDRVIVGTEEHPFYVKEEHGCQVPQWKAFRDLTTADSCGMIHGDTYVWTKPEWIQASVSEVAQPVYNFEVETDNSYIVENTIVHNCQGFSHAGKKRTDDPRNELVHEFVRATKLIQPTWIVGENVKGLLSRKGVYPPKTPARPIIDIIKELFEGIGYRLTYKVVDATEVGVPQLRKRLILIGHKGDLYPHVAWPTAPTPSPTIRALLTPTLEGAVELPATPYKPAEQPPRFWISTTATAPTGTPHPNLLRLVAGIRNLSTKEKEATGLDPKEKVPFTETEGLISFGVRKGGYHGQVLDPDAPSKTIICAYNQCPRLFVGLHNAATGKYWVRCLTVEECGQIQGFPADYAWKGAHKDKIVQIGNAVPPPLAAAVAKMIAEARFEKSPQVAVAAEGDDDSEEEE
jgi:DNA (cytosine-5)-methyltransferase 1